MEKSIRSDDYWRLLRVLRELRLDAGLRQADVADRLGLTQPFVSKYESGERRLDVLELIQVAAALGTTLTQILDRAGIDHD